jgi:hypothetical protein
MVRISGVVAMAACIGLMSVGASAASPAQNEEVEALRLAGQRIEQDYIDAARAREVADALRRRPVTSQGAALADELTQVLRSLSRDPHFRFGYSNEPMPADIFEPKAGGDAEAAARRTARINNYGVVRAERLPGNIGFLDLDQFADPALMRRPLAAAMELLEHCDALIVDLRYNGGGYARGAALAASYFLPEAPQRTLVRLESRDPR